MNYICEIDSKEDFLMHALYKTESESPPPYQFLALFRFPYLFYCREDRKRHP